MCNLLKEIKPEPEENTMFREHAEHDPDQS